MKKKETLTSVPLDSLNDTHEDKIRKKINTHQKTLSAVCFEFDTFFGGWRRNSTAPSSWVLDILLISHRRSSTNNFYYTDFYFPTWNYSPKERQKKKIKESNSLMKSDHWIPFLIGFIFFLHFKIPLTFLFFLQRLILLVEQ